MYYLMMRLYTICPEKPNGLGDITMEPRAVALERGTIDEMVKELDKYKREQVGYFLADYWIER